MTWKYSDLILEQDELEGVKLFARKINDETEDHKDRVLTFLRKYPKVQTMHMINNQAIISIKMLQLMLWYFF